MPRGTLRIYLGAAPGVGKTFAMLSEGRRRRDRGTDVVVAVVETHGRARTTEQLGDLEVVPRRRIEHRGTVLEELDLDAVLARRPDLALVDELAHTNAPGSRNEKRWQDVEDLLAAGIDVISTVNVQHLESLNDVVARITGVTQRETVPDAVVRRGDQIELVDMSPEALRRRMAHGNIYPPDRVDAALTNYFRPGNLGALRELALLWVADRVEESLASYLGTHGITDAWETRERVVVGVAGSPSGDAIVRRAARIAGRAGGELIGVHVAGADGLAMDQADQLDEQRRLVVELGGRMVDVVGTDPAEALVSCARAEKATQIVVGASQRSRWYEIWHGSFVARVSRLASDIDVHVISHPGTPTMRNAARRPERPRRALAWALTIVGLPLLTIVTVAMRRSLELETELLLFLALVLGISVLGGRLVGFVSAVASSLLVNWYFVEPLHTFTIAEPENLIALVVFVAVATTVGTFVDLAATRALEARRSAHEAAALARAAATVAADADPVPRLTEQILEVFGLDGLRIETSGPEVVAMAGSPVDTPTWEMAFGDSHRLVADGRQLSQADQRVMRSLLDQLAVAIESREHAAGAEELATLATMDAVRTALLRAVSHDLRTPLASIKALVSGLIDPDACWSDDDRREALLTVDTETDRLDRVVGNLLDASRLQIGALAVRLDAVDVADVVASALADVPGGDAIVQDVADQLAPVVADAALLERALANIASNALRHSGDAGPRVSADLVGDRVVICVIDTGRGIPPAQRSSVTAPFQRLGDNGAAVEGVGLGLSVASGFIGAMGGTLDLDDTPGGGLTVTITLPCADGTR